MWSENERQVLKELKKTCLIHMYLQSGSAFLNYILHNAITLPNIALGAVTSVSIFSTLQPQWRMASGAMAICSTVLTGLSRQLAPGERAQLHASVTKQYQSVVRNINTKLLLEPVEEERQHFIDHTKSEIDRLLSLQPEPSLWIIRRFENKYQDRVEKALYPEFAHLEKEMVRNAENISNRVSAPRITAGAARSAYHLSKNDSMDPSLSF